MLNLVIHMGRWIEEDRNCDSYNLVQGHSEGSPLETHPRQSEHRQTHQRINNVASFRVPRLQWRASSSSPLDLLDATIVAK